MEAKCIIFLNQKGGVAKTTSTYNIAAAKAKEGKTVLMVDLDPQCSLTIAAGIEPGEARLEGHSTCDLLNPKIDPLDAVFGVRGIEGLYIVPSDIELAMMEKKLIIQMNSEIKLRAAIRKLREHFDYIFIDCPPQLGQLSINALVAADEVVIPCKTDYLSYRGLKALIETIEEVREEQINPDIVIVGIIATFLEARVKDQQAVLKLMQEQRIPVIGTVRKSADVSRNLVKGMPVMIALPGSDVAQEYITIANKL